MNRWEALERLVGNEASVLDYGLGAWVTCCIDDDNVHVTTSDGTRYVLSDEILIDIAQDLVPIG